MLRQLIANKVSVPPARILRHYESRYLPHALLVPSARFGLYAVAKELLSPGDGVLISPVTCRRVILALLAAGVRPVFADIELETGNIDPFRLTPGLLRSARAIITTNLYGNPDRVDILRDVAQEHGLTLIEDCAHVLDTTIGDRRIGASGDVSVFSFKKFFDEPGGVITVGTEDARRRLSARIEREAIMPSASEQVARYLQYVIERGGGHTTAAAFSALYRLARRSSQDSEESESESVPVNGVILPTGTDYPPFASLLRTDALLARCDALSRDRRAAAAGLIERCPLTLKARRNTDLPSFLVVPFFCPERDEVVARLQRRGVPAYFLYRPPLNQVFPEFVPDSGLDTAQIAEWSRNVLPVPLQFGNEYLDVIQSVLGRYEICDQRRP